ncbi:HlyD family type I secretion periplasmic adaptor subunit [Massilia sp. W12]|uniref:HlyD family type I secretion periplasmic adaptor subunit n=1 Tax=Massilia sp. W12 TaxID=3126507 RepID=UPI0030D03710
MNQQPDASKGQQLGRRQRRLLADSLHIEEEMAPRFVRRGILILALIVFICVGWAALTEMPEIAHAPGEVIPRGEIKVVQHLDGGIVSQILVEDKRLVQAGQTLLKLDGAQSQAELAQLQVRYDGLRARAERLAAQADQRVPEFSKLALQDRRSALDQQQLYQSALSTKQSALAILEQQIEQRGNRLKQLQASLQTAQEQAKVASEMQKLREDLAEQRLINRVTLLETRRAALSAQGEVARLQQEIAVITHERDEVLQRRADYLNQARRDVLAELGAVNGESSEVEQSLKRLRAKVERLEVRAPATGHVHDLRVQTVGQVIMPGALLMQVVPDNVTLEVVVRISSQDIGYVKVGQPVNLRSTSYDYARYGFAKGVLQRISASHLVDENNRPYFRGWVRLTQPWVGNEAGKYPLRTGMGVIGEIRTGEKSLLAYLTKPLVNAVSGAFQER